MKKIILIMMVLVMAACSSDLNKEVEQYKNYLEEDQANEAINQYIDEYFAEIDEGKPDEAIVTMKEKLIPLYNEEIARLEKLDFKSDEMKNLLEKHVETLSLEADVHKMLLENFMLIKGTTEKGAEKIQLAHSFEGVYLYIENVTDRQSETEALFEDYLAGQQPNFYSFDLFTAGDLEEAEDNYTALNDAFRNGLD